MPEGVAVVVGQDGFATIDFVDPAKRGTGIAALLIAGGPQCVQKLSRVGPRILYRVPERVARKARLLDKVSKVDSLEKPDTSSGKNVAGFVPPSGEWVD